MVEYRCFLFTYHVAFVTTTTIAFTFALAKAATALWFFYFIKQVALLL